MGCLRTIGCLTVLVVLAGAAYLTRDLWYPATDSRGRSPDRTSDAWEPLTARGADRVQRAADALGSRTAPPFEVVSGADFAAYALQTATGRLTSLGDSAQAAVVDDELRIRGTIARLGRPFELAGTLDIVRPAVAELRVRRLTVGALPIPRAVLPRIIQELGYSRAIRDSSNGVLVVVPPAVRDIRVARGHITLYKNAP